jgi:hypothetical protein
VTRLRLLFEGLEERILLAADPAALAAAGWVKTITHSTQAVDQQPRILGAGEAFAGTLSLPKFEQKAGRTLLSAQLSLTVSTTDGNREFDSTLDAVQDIRISHIIDAEGWIFYGPVSAALTADPLPPEALSAAVLVNADSGTVGVGPNEDGDTGPPLYLPIADFEEGEGDWYRLPIPADSDADSTGYTYGQAGLQNFIATPANAELGIGYRGEPDGVKVGVGGTQFNPEPFYNVTATVTYQYTYIPRDLDWARYGALPEYEPEHPRFFQPLFSGTGEPGAMIRVDLYDVRNDPIGSMTVPVDAGGNWMANFPGTNVDLMPHSLVLRQTFPNHNALADAGYNLRTYFRPAIMGGMYISEYLTVENVLGSRSVDVSVDALYRASLSPIVMGWHAYPQEFLTNTVVASGI